MQMTYKKLHAHTHKVHISFNIYTQIAQSENENARKPNENN